MNNPERLATLGTQNTRRRESKNTTQYVLDTAVRKQKRLTQIEHGPSKKQLEIKTNRKSFVCHCFLCVYQARKYIIVLGVSIFCLLLRFFDWILKLF